MRGNEIDPVEQIPYPGPVFPERRFSLHIAPGNAMQVGKYEIPSWRPEEGIPFFNDRTVFGNDNGQGARAVAAIIRGLEIDCREPGE
jgi:hypothetical protein